MKGIKSDLVDSGLMIDQSLELEQRRIKGDAKALDEAVGRLKEAHEEIHRQEQAVVARQNNLRGQYEVVVRLLQNQSAGQKPREVNPVDDVKQGQETGEPKPTEKAAAVPYPLPGADEGKTTDA